MDNLLSFLEDPEEDSYNDDSSLNSDVPRPQTYAPQPLATRELYPRRDHIHLKRRHAEFRPYDFRKPIPLVRSKSTIDFINPAAIRSRRMYQEIEQDQDFLLQMRKQWCLKLEELKRDRELLLHMASMEENDVPESRPLIRYTPPQTQIRPQRTFQTVNKDNANHTAQQQPTTQRTVEELLAATASNTHNDTLKDAQDNTQSDIEGNDDQEEEDELDLSDILGDEVEASQAYPELDDLDEEERTRRALTQMLQEFGPEW